MFRVLVQAGLVAAALYALAGLAFAVAFHRRGLARLDPAAAGGGLGFRLLITPGLIALWPVLAWRWRRAVRGIMALPPPETTYPPPARLRAWHRLAWQALAIALTLLLAVALLTRPSERAPSVLPAAVPPSAR